MSHFHKNIKLQYLFLYFEMLINNFLQYPNHNLITALKNLHFEQNFP